MCSLLDDKALDCGSSHGMVLSLHLLKLLKSSRRFADLLTTKFDPLRIIKCLHPIQQQFTVSGKRSFAAKLDFIEEVFLISRESQ